MTTSAAAPPRSSGIRWAVSVILGAALLLSVERVGQTLLLPSLSRRSSFTALAGGGGGGGGSADGSLRGPRLTEDSGGALAASVAIAAAAAAAASPCSAAAAAAAAPCPAAPPCPAGDSAGAPKLLPPAAPLPCSAEVPPPGVSRMQPSGERVHEPTSGVDLAANPFLTQQECFENSDESEVCILRGPVCLADGDFIGVAREPRPDYGSHDPTTWCPDHRAYRRTYECKHKRPNLPPEAYAEPEAWMHGVGALPLIPPERRRWGAADSQGMWREVPWQALVKGSSPAALKALGPQWEAAAAAADTSFLPAFGESLGINSLKMSRVRWLDGPVYFANMRGEWIDHIWHWSTAAFQLFEAKRLNRSTVNVPGFSAEPGHMNINIGPLAMPPMDYVVMYGKFPRPVRSITDFPGWMQNVWPALSQPQTQILANGLFTDPESPFYLQGHLQGEEPTMLCTTHAVYSSFKSSLFSGQRDAHAFKLVTYAKAGVEVPAYGRYPPRQITVLTRASRGLWNLDEILPVLEATGMPVRVIYDMGALTWAEQVRAMAESGILVAVHGAALTNVIFMPANAVLIEVFPWNYRSFLYRDLAWKAGLQYYPMSSVYPDFENIDPALLAQRGDGVYGVYNSAEYQTKCSGPHMSSMDVYSIAECTHRAKYTFPMVNIEQLKVVVQDALDDIGCRDSYCHEVEFRRNDEPVIHHITHMPTKNKTQYIP